MKSLFNVTRMMLPVNLPSRSITLMPREKVDITDEEASSRGVLKHIEKKRAKVSGKAVKSSPDKKLKSSPLPKKTVKVTSGDADKPEGDKKEE